MRFKLLLLVGLFGMVAMLRSVAAQSSDSRPNILWLSAEDISAHLGCYGDPHAITPNLDQLAAEGMRYTHAFTVAGVCAPNRSAIITGMYQTSIGTQHMRGPARMPPFVRPFTQSLREAGYYCSNNSKQDYQFSAPKGSWDDSSGRAHWRGRPEPETPFFSVFNFGGCHESGIANPDKYRSVTANLPDEWRQDPEALSTFPPYYPETLKAREDWKRNYELISALDLWVADLIAQLKEDGLYDNTIIFFWSDHGVGLPRAKRWLYDSGTRVPLIVRIPEGLDVADQAPAGSVSDRLVSSIDFAPTVLRLAGLSAPRVMQGRPFLGPERPAPRNYVFGARDRMDERYDIIRMARDSRFKYIRNFEPLKTFYQYMNTPEKGATMADLRRLWDAGALEGIPARYFAPRKPVEELYDTESDPHELHNLADDPQYRNELERLRSASSSWAKRTGDTGLIPEPLLARAEARNGSRYGAMDQGRSSDLRSKLLSIADVAARGDGPESTLIAGLQAEEAEIRYWAATGLGNMSAVSTSAKEVLHAALEDEESVVRSAAALALGRHGIGEQSVGVLARELETGAQWERLHAAIALDEVDELALPALEAMRRALTPRPELYANGKYVVRVINRALNELEGTSRQVP